MVDIVARPMAESMKKKFPKGVAVLNRPGGGGSVGLAEVVQAKPDGYTICLAPNSTLVIHPQLNDLPYRTPDDYEPILSTISFYTLHHREGRLALQDDAGVRGRRQGVSRQAAGRHSGRRHDQSPDPRAMGPRRQTSSSLTCRSPAGARRARRSSAATSTRAMAQPGEVKPLVDAKKLRVLAVAEPAAACVLP